MKIAGINFDHVHMGDLLRYAFEHPRAEIVGICDEPLDRMHSAAMNFNIPSHGKVPIEVTTVVNETPGIEVDEHSITIARYETGLSKIETRWGTFTDPWVTQTQPKCGFELIGTDGTISSYDYEKTITVQTRQRLEAHAIPVDPLLPPYQNPVQYFIPCLETGEPITGPLSLEISRIGQQIVDTAVISAREKRTVRTVS